ncbi:ankyrin repeat domain-containing protein [Acidovorax sp. NCPPB 2350]|nr:ankyrin repeat domain-containing protein [Acidovorax sp. NCPPB 2350]
MVPTPYPRFGECLRALANCLDTKNRDRGVDRLAREGDFDWERLDAAIGALLLDGTRRVIGPLADTLIAPWITEAREAYCRLLMEVPLDAVRREQALPVLAEQFFVPWVADLLLRAHAAVPGPRLPLLLGPDRSPVEEVFGWLDAQVGANVGTLLHPETTDRAKAERDKLHKWRHGTDIPSAQGIRLLVEALRGHPRCREGAEACALWLLVASALARCERLWPQVPVRRWMLRHLLAPLDSGEVSCSLRALVPGEGPGWPEMADLGRRLWHDLRRTSPKQAGDPERIREGIGHLERMAGRCDPEGRTAYHFEWMKARWHMLGGRHAEALPYYERAFEGACYRAGPGVKDLIEEAICLAAFLGKVPLAKRLKHAGIAFGLFQRPPREGAVVEGWEWEPFLRQLPLLFPSQGRFVESAPDAADGLLPGCMAISREAVDAIPLDRRNPDQVRAIRFEDGTTRRWPQLRLFASFGKAAQVRQLLGLGASVDALDASGGSALLCAIQHAENTGNREVLDLLLQAPHQPATLNAHTHRKRLTPLVCAIDLGEPDVVAALLERGAQADLPALTDHQSPLYYAVSRMFGAAHPQRFLEGLMAALLAPPDAVGRDTLRRFGVMAAGAMGADATAVRRAPDRALQVARAQVKRHARRFPMGRIGPILEALLKAGADPNRVHGYPVRGRTPLMLAAESDLPWALERMMAHGGNPWQEDAQGWNCLRIAEAWGARQAVAYLRGRAR